MRQTFDALLARKDAIVETVATDLDAILQGTEGDMEKQRAYASRLSTTLESAPQGHVFFNGKHFDLDDVRSPLLLRLYSCEADRHPSSRTSCAIYRLRVQSTCSIFS